MISRYLDTAFVVKCYVPEVGSDAVRSLALETDELVTSALTGAEFAAAVHRKRREYALTQHEAAAVMSQFGKDCAEGIWTLIPVNAGILLRVTTAFASLPVSIALRAADAIHCASAVAYGLDRIYSNDRHLLGAASHFELLGVDVIAA
jgi:predicted nucleic acid-binding protein